MMDDKQYRKMVSEIFSGISAAFDNVDPDIAEADYSQGSVTILSKGTKTIISPQPPVRQIWLAAASQGLAIHFDFDPEAGLWLDDKGHGYELYAFTEEVLKKICGEEIALRPAGSAVKGEREARVKP
jgi:CyaY protein